MKQKLLFLCTGNSVRSQMVEGLLGHFSGGRFEAFSAGTHPVGLNQWAVAVMKELGIDISHQQSKSITAFPGQQFDYVITVCDRAKESCPIWPQSTNVRHWSFKDPAAGTGSDEEQRQIFRKVRDQIADRINKFLSESGGQSH